MSLSVTCAEADGPWVPELDSLGAVSLVRRPLRKQVVPKKPQSRPY